ncbi:MAG: maltodextrin glucosidase [Thermoleophilia bacterium]|nr:maltodextrin glucosidase [Thermoleophilia bacterium]
MASLLSMPHHDGSELYAPDPAAELGDETTVLLRVSKERAADDVALRYVRDGEPQVAAAVVDRETEDEVWWQASFPVANPTTPYRWLLSGGDFGYAWVNGAGLQSFDVPDADDFVATSDPGGPDWHLESVVYQVFPDRFASAGLDVDPPDWAVPRKWGELPTGRGPETPFEWFGGDLVGLEQQLDHIEELGANVLYLTPIFPASSTHRYDASSFDTVDPLLGGDEALTSLVRAAHGRGIRVLGDLTTNHVGAEHAWFTAAQERREPEREFFYFDERLAVGYECWSGVPTLPKLNYESRELRGRMYDHEGSVVRRWLEPPMSLDGWRIDVANMTGRLRDLDVLHDVSRGMRAAAVAARSDAVIVAEHAHDARADLRESGWHGTMNYPGFTRPVWTWLRGEELPADPRNGFIGLPVGVPRLPGGSVVETMRRFRAGVPWQSALHSWVLLDSHDTARFRTIAGSRERQLVGIGLQMTTPGVPMVFAGDEIGLEGEWGEDARRTMPWDHPETWDEELLEAYRRLVSLRLRHRALSHGGIRYAHVSADAIGYLREVPGETILCLAARADHDPVRLQLAALQGGEFETLAGSDASIDGCDAVLPSHGPAFHVWRVR